MLNPDVRQNQPRFLREDPRMPEESQEREEPPTCSKGKRKKVAGLGIVSQVEVEAVEAT